MNDGVLLTTRQVAEYLGVTIRRVQAMIRDGRLTARKVGRDWLIRPADVELVKQRRTGRPRKEGSNEGKQ